jgi:hypothetical protein
MPRTRDQSIDRQIDEWSGGSPVSVKEVHPNCKFDVSEDNCTMICTLVYAVVYQLMPGYKKDVMARPGKLPLWARGTPCIEAMDGISGQPITVMAPDFVLLTYSDLFKPSSEGDNDERDCYEEPLYAGGKREIPLPACS